MVKIWVIIYIKFLVVKFDKKIMIKIKYKVSKYMEN